MDKMKTPSVCFLYLKFPVEVIKQITPDEAKLLNVLSGDKISYPLIDVHIDKNININLFGSCPIYAFISSSISGESTI